MTTSARALDAELHRSCWVVVPVYNEAGAIGAVVTELLATFPHVVCVDDGSTDGSAEVAKAAGAVVVRHPVNLGQGAALQTGFEYTLLDPAMRHVLTYDADGQHQIADALDLLERVSQGDADVVFGSRFLDERTRTTPSRRLILRLAVAYTNLTTRTRLSDAHNGLRALARPVVERLDITQNRMAHASELVAQVGSMTIDGRPVTYTETAVHILYTDYSKQKGQSLWNAINILVDLIVH